MIGMIDNKLERDSFIERPIVDDVRRDCSVLGGSVRIKNLTQRVSIAYYSGLAWVYQWKATLRKGFI